jgi:hypothetical protein
MPWDDFVVIGGISFIWKSGRNPITGMFGGNIYVPRGVIAQCDSCRVPHKNNDHVYALDPWTERNSRAQPGICTDCHNQLKTPDRKNLHYVEGILR